MKTTFHQQFFLALLSLLGMCGSVSAEDDGIFIYSNGDHTIIGLTEAGMGRTDLTIPATVTQVNSLYGGQVATLTIEGNPEFGNDVLSYVKSTLTSIDAGSSMSSTNIKKMLNSLGTGNNLTTLEIDGYTDTNATINWTDMTGILTAAVKVWMPAALVGSQKFGNAEVYGSFTLTGELATFCGSATFDDTDDGSNFLFYIPTELRTQSKEVFIQRVRYVKANQGVLIHNLAGSSHTVRLKRVDVDNLGDKEAGYNTEIAKYTNNMLIGITTPTYIPAIVGEKTNLILYQGAFHPVEYGASTEDGTLRANRAYLQVLTSEFDKLHLNNAPLRFTFSEEESTDIKRVDSGELTVDSWCTLSGQRLSGRPSVSGTYIHNGRTIVVK